MQEQNTQAGILDPGSMCALAGRAESESRADTSSGKCEDTAAQFLFEEFRLLRGEVEERSKEQRAMERNVIIVTTAIISFLVINPPSEKPDAATLVFIGWILPPFVAFLALSRWLESLAMIKRLAQYIETYERSVVVPKGGWESNLSQFRTSHKLAFVSTANAAFWEIMTGVPAGLAAKHTISGAAYDLAGWFAALLVGAVTAWAASIMIRRAELDKFDPLLSR